MIKLTELFFSKDSLSFEKEPIMIDINFVSTIRPNKITMRAPTIEASKVFGENVPDEYIKEVASTECTTITFKNNSHIDVEETFEQIEKMLNKED